MSAADDENDGQATERVVIRDRRKIDAKSEVKKSSGAQDASTAGAHRAADPEEETVAEEEDIKTVVDDAELAALRAELEERTHDLQRITAEYANYRRRVDRDRESVLVGARVQFVSELLTVLDDLDRAEAHGDLTGPFKAVADKLVAVVQKLGLEPFGLEGEPFDPSVHEAVESLRNVVFGASSTATLEETKPKREANDVHDLADDGDGGVCRVIQFA